MIPNASDVGYSGYYFGNAQTQASICAPGPPPTDLLIHFSFGIHRVIDFENFVQDGKTSSYTCLHENNNKMLVGFQKKQFSLAFQLLHQAHVTNSCQTSYKVLHSKLYVNNKWQQRNFEIKAFLRNLPFVKDLLRIYKDVLNSVAFLLDFALLLPLFCREGCWQIMGGIPDY